MMIERNNEKNTQTTFQKIIRLEVDSTFRNDSRFKSRSNFASPKRRIEKMKKIEKKGFALPGMPADFKELVSPFAMKIKDYSALYDGFEKQEQEFSSFPSVRPRFLALRKGKVNKAFNFSEKIRDKKVLGERRSKSRLLYEYRSNNFGI